MHGAPTMLTVVHVHRVQNFRPVLTKGVKRKTAEAVAAKVQLVHCVFLVHVPSLSIVSEIDSSPYIVDTCTVPAEIHIIMMQHNFYISFYIVKT